MSFWTDRPVLVTGATGLLGSWLCEALAARGADVVALVRDLVPQSLFFTGAGGRRCTTVFGDLRDGRLIERVLAEYEIDAVFHLGAQTIVEHALRDPANTMRSNVEGTWEVLDACRRSGRPDPDRRRLVRQGLRHPARAALPGAPSARRPPPLRRLQELRRPDRPELRRHLRPAGRDHALRQPLRRRRPELQPARARARSAPRCRGSGRCCAATAPSSATTSTSRTRPRPTSPWPSARTSPASPARPGTSPTSSS